MTQADIIDTQGVLLQGFVDSLPFYVLVVDEDHRIVAANTAVLESLDLPIEAVVGQWCPQLIHGLSHIFPGCPLESAVRSGASAEEVEYQDPDTGDWYSSAVYLMEERRHGRRLYSHMVRDITARKRAEDELRTLNENLENLVEERTAEAVSANRAKSDFLAAMSHELRTPLNSIIGFAGIMYGGLAGETTDEQKRQLGMVQRSGQHLLALVNDILDLSKIEAGGFELDISDFVLGDVVRAAKEIVHLGAERKGLALEVIVDDERAILRTDMRALEQVLVNLLGNAVKFTDKGTVRLEASSTGDGRVVIRVTDTGCGISEEGLKGIFDPFKQVGAPNTQGESGTGLGLAIASRLARNMDGSIRVESREGKGSTFTLDIPALVIIPDDL